MRSAKHGICLTVIRSNQAYLAPQSVQLGPVTYLLWLPFNLCSCTPFCIKHDQLCRRERSPGQKSKRPNFFFALQVSQSAAVTAAIKSVHDSLVQHAKDLQAALVEPETAHLTVMVTALDSEEEVQHAEAAMESFTNQLVANEALAKPLALTLEGLSHFHHQVQQTKRVLQLLSALLPVLQGVQGALSQIMLL